MIPSSRRAASWMVAVALGFASLAASNVPPAQAAEPSSPLARAEELARRAAKLRDERKYDEALPLAEEVVRLRESSSAPGAARADAYAALAYLLRAKGERERAVDSARKALAARELAEPGSLHLADDLVALAATLEENGDHAATEAPLRRAFPILEASAATDVSLLVTTAGWLASFELASYANSGDAARLAAAEGQARAAIRAAERTPTGSLARARAELLLGQVFAAGHDERCEEILRRVSSGLEASKDPAAAQHRAEALSYLGAYLAEGDRLREAAEVFRRSLASSEAHNGATHAQTIAVADSLAAVLNRAGEHAEALVVAESALRRARPGVGYYRCDLGLARDVGLRRTVADARSGLGDHRGALAVLEEGLTFLEKGQTCTRMRGLPGAEGSSSTHGSERADNVKDHPLAYADCLMSLAAIQTQMLMQEVSTDAGVAEQRFRRAIDVALKSGPPGVPYAAVARGNLGLLLWKVGRLEEAESLMRQGRAGAKGGHAGDHNLGLVLQDRGKLDEAEQVFRTSIRDTEAMGEDPSAGGSSLGLLLLQRGRIAESQEVTARLEATLDRQLDRAVLGGSDAQRRMLMARVNRLGRLPTTLHLQALPEDPSAARAALGSILRRKGRALDAGHSAIDAIRRRGNASDVEALESLARARRRLADAALAGQAEAKLEPLERYVRKLEGDLAKKYASIRAETAPTSVDAVRRRLRPQQALVELVTYHRFERGSWSSPRYAAYVLKPDGAILSRDLGDAAALDARVRAARQALGAIAPDASTRLRELDEVLFRPIRAMLGDAREVLFAPEGSAALVPMGALVDESGRYAVERYRFTVLSSGRDLLRESGAPPTLAAPVLVGAPDFDLALPLEAGKTDGPGSIFSKVHFTPLPGTDKETRELAALVPGARRLSAGEATKQAVLGLHSPRFLHVATHGFFLASDTKATGEQRGLTLVDDHRAPLKDPLVRSGLAFAGANRAASGGILSALEASNLDLWGTQLVVLSACETGVGEVEPGEGVLGLRRALVLAGAQTQVMSLWKVSDVATETLMVRYYQRALAGGGRSEAMRDAQLAVASASATRHPYYWAAFVVSGDDSTFGGGTPDPVREVTLVKAASPASPGVPPVERRAGGCACRAVPSSSDGAGAAIAGLALVAAGVRRSRRRADVCAPER